MSPLRTTLATVVLLSCCTTAAAAPEGRFRRATEADLAALPHPVSVAPDAPATESRPATSAVRARIDPVTGQLVESPVVDEPEAERAAKPQPDFTVRRSPEGFLYIDTSNYLQETSVEIGPDGELRFRCDVAAAPHGAAEHEAHAGAPPEAPR